VTGVLFERPGPGGIAGAVQRLVERDWDAEVIRVHSEAFSEERFVDRLRALVS